MLMIASAAIGGALISLWNMDWRKLSLSDRIFVFVGGISCGVFGAPYVAKLIGVSTADLSEACGVTFFGSAFGLLLMPSLRSRLSKILGLKKEDEA